MSRVKTSLDHKRIRCLVWLVLIVFVLLGYSLQSVAGSAYYSMVMQAYAMVTSPPVILEEGNCSGASTIYANKTSAKVNVTAPLFDYVDSNDSDVDSSADIGIHSNFTAQKYGPDLINDTLTEGNTRARMWLYVNTDDETRTGWTRVGTNPYLDAIDYNTSYVYVSGNNKLVGDFGFTDSGKSTEIINSVTVQIYAQQSNIKTLEVSVWDGSSWTSLGTQTLTTFWRWENYTATTVLNTWTKIDGAKIYLKTTTGSGTYEVDCARLQVDYTDPDNYGLDLEVQWINLDYDENNEVLCIYGGTMGSENITVDAWDGSAWENLFTDLFSGWNNVSVSSYLTSSNFTIRFKGSNETGDITQDSWNIDATLLHVWTGNSTYDYVLQVVNQVASNWTINLQVYDNSSIARLSNTTISFHDGSSSDQIIVSGGAITQSEGPSYNLAGNATIYISMKNVKASASGNSYLYVHLKIQVPNTSTYILYVITFEII